MNVEPKNSTETALDESAVLDHQDENQTPKSDKTLKSDNTAMPNLNDSEESLENQIKATDEQIKANDELIKATDELIEANDELIEANDEQIKATDEQAKDGKSEKTEKSQTPELIKDKKTENGLRKEARKVLSESKKLFKRAKKQLSEERQKEVLHTIQALETALTDETHSCALALANMKEVSHKRLRFARKSGTQEVFESLIFALAFALVLRTFLVEPFKIPTRSMVPTLLEGDQLFVTKLSYGIRLPFYNDYIVWFSQPQRGEVVVFAFPREEAAKHLMRTNSGCMQAESLAGEKDYIKRIIGVEGDTIEVIDQVIHVNGEPVAQQPIYERTVSDYMYLTDRRKESWNREMHGNATYTTITHELPSSHFGPIKVLPGHVFVMGDNRDNSADSRCWGQVPVKNIKGRAQIIWWSTGHIGPRWERMFTWIY